MFAVIYKSYLKEGKEEEFQAAWKIVASYFAKERGAIGSTIHRSEEGYYVTYSKWPDKATRDASWPKDDQEFDSSLPDSVKQAGMALKNCLDTREVFPEVCMEIIDELS